ncbi:MAG: glycine cleavage system aminomethyltransferase GcvT [Planctomycetota bacterium]|nr:glycine cleavage system aminomethyltransferase GcvT [Planctomycetota bacterium]
MTTTTDTTTLKHTPFHDFHNANGAKLVDYTGWEMPLHYGSIIDEHHQVRKAGGLFDVSHMGRFRFKGKDARAFLDRVCTRQIWGMSDGQIRYSMVCNHEGGVKDDVLVYRIGETEYLMVCNAANRMKLIEHFNEVKDEAGFVFKFEDETEATAMIAIQGPKVMELMSNFSSEVPTLKRYRFTIKNLIIAKVMISRTGYTGEDGVEIILPAKFAAKAIDMMLKNVDMDAEEPTIKPIGLGARDSLRLESGMALYGHEIDEHLDPVSAGLDFAIKYDKSEDPEKSPEEVGRFIGQDALQKFKSEGTPRKLVGLNLEGRRSARQGMKIYSGGGESEVGFVTSGVNSPTLGKCIAMAYVDTGHCETGSKLQIDLGRAKADAEVIALPFYKAP